MSPPVPPRTPPSPGAPAGAAASRRLPQAHLVCVRRSSGGARIEKVGVEVGGEVKHYHPAGVLFALKMGAWRLLYTPPGAGRPLEVGVGVDAHGREHLRVAHALSAGSDGLRDAPGCTHGLHADEGAAGLR